MNEKFSLKKMQDFIDSEMAEELTPQEEMRRFQSLKLSILDQSEEQLKRAYRINDTAMVVAIAEVLKTIDLP